MPKAECNTAAGRSQYRHCLKSSTIAHGLAKESVAWLFQICQSHRDVPRAPSEVSEPRRISSLCSPKQ